MTVTRRAAAAAITMMIALAACSTSVPVRYYTLAPLPETGAVPAQRILVALEPVELANYLERPEFVTRRGPTALRVAEIDRWGEQLDVLIGRVLAQNLVAVDPRLDVVLIPTAFTVRPDRQLVVEIDRFEADETGRVTLDARWQIVPTSGRGQPVAGRSRITEEAAGAAGPEPAHNAIAEAMSRALAALAREIAPKIQG